jgi:hypothetical protein
VKLPCRTDESGWKAFPNLSWYRSSVSQRDEMASLKERLSQNTRMAPVVTFTIPRESQSPVH